MTDRDSANTTFEVNERQSSDWDIRNAPRNYAWLVISQLASALFSFASVWLITKTIGAEGYGGVVALIAASQVVQIFVNWSSTALIRFGVEEFVVTGKITKSFWSRSAIFFPNVAAVLILSYFWLPPLAGWLKIPTSSTWLIPLHICSTALWLHFQYALQGAKLLRLQGAMLVVERALTFFVLLALVGLDQAGVGSFLLSYIIPPLVMSIASCVGLRAFIDLKLDIYSEQSRQMLVFSLPLIPFTLIGYLSTSQLDALFINQIMSKSDLGIYAIAAQISGLTLQLPIIANGVLLSMFVSLKANRKDSAIAGFFHNIVPSLTLAWGGFCAVLSVACGLLIPLVFGDKFLPATKPLWILLAASTPVFPILIGLATLSNTYSRTYISLVASVLSAFANISLNLTLIPSFGFVGSAWATGGAAVASLIAFYFLLRRDNLLASNWIFVAILPAIAGAVAVTFDLGLVAALGVTSLTSLLVAYYWIESIRQAVLILKKRLVLGVFGGTSSPNL